MPVPIEIYIYIYYIWSALVRNLKWRAVKLGVDISTLKSS